MKKGIRTLFLLLSALILITGNPAWAGESDLTKPFEGMSGEIRISGGTAHIPVLKDLARKIMKKNPDVRISIAGGGSGVGIKQVGEGLVDIGNSGRKPKDEEISRYGLHLYKWAIDGVAVVVNKKNGVRSLSSDQLKDLFAGNITNWKELGGHDLAVNLYTRDEASGTRSVFWKKALKKGAISKKAGFVKSNGAMKSAVASDPGAIGYISAGHIDESVAAVALDGVTPTLDNIRLGNYPVARGLYSNTKGEASGLVAKFIGCLFAPEGQKIIASKGFIPVK